MDAGKAIAAVVVTVILGVLIILYGNSRDSAGYERGKAEVTAQWAEDKVKQSGKLEQERIDAFKAGAKSREGIEHEVKNLGDDDLDRSLDAIGFLRTAT